MRGAVAPASIPLPAICWSRAPAAEQTADDALWRAHSGWRRRIGAGERHCGVSRRRVRLMAVAAEAAAAGRVGRIAAGASASGVPTAVDADVLGPALPIATAWGNLLPEYRRPSDCPRPRPPRVGGGRGGGQRRQWSGSSLAIPAGVLELGRSERVVGGSRYRLEACRRHPRSHRCPRGWRCVSAGATAPPAVPSGRLCRRARHAVLALVVLEVVVDGRGLERLAGLADDRLFV